MSYDLQVYARAERLPKPDALREALRVNPDLTLDSPLDVSVQKGFFPLRLVGQKSGFELGLSRVGKEDIEDYLEDLRDSGESEDEEDPYLTVLRSSDTVVHFRCHGDVEIKAARIVAEALARLCRGALIDPQKDTQESF